MAAKPPVMIMVAPNGAYMMKHHNPAVPISPAEIADEVVRCAAAGASIAHLHARGPQGKASFELAVFREIVDRVRERSDIVVQLSLGTTGFTVDQALEPVALGPEMVTFPMRSFNAASGGIPADISEMAHRIKASGVTAELDVADQSMLAGARQLIDAGLIAAPTCFGVLVKETETMRKGTANLLDMTAGLPEKASWWSIAKANPHALGLHALAIELGGNVRTGFEDTVSNFDGSGPASSNAVLVEKLATLCASLGRAVATPQQVRQFLAGGRA